MEPEGLEEPQVKFQGRSIFTELTAPQRGIQKGGSGKGDPEKGHL